MEQRFIGGDLKIPMKSFGRTLCKLISIGGAILWTFLLLKIWKFLRSFAGWGDGATDSSLHASDLIIALIVWCAPMLFFVALFRWSTEKDSTETIKKSSDERLL